MTTKKQGHKFSINYLSKNELNHKTDSHIMKTTFNIQFYCRESKKNKQGLSPIEMSININGKRTFIQLPRKEYPHIFHKQITSKRGNDIKEYIEQMRIKINMALTELIKQNIPLTIHTLKDYIQNGGVKQYTIDKMFEDYLQLISTKVGINITKQTKRKYEIVKDYFFQVIDKNRQANSLTEKDILQFYNWLKIEKNETDATSGSKMQKLRTIITHAFENGNLTKNCMTDIKINKGKPKIEYLTDNEVIKITDFQHPSKSLTQTRDLFLFQIYSGLAYADLMALKKEDLQTVDGQYFIKKERIKTGVNFISVVDKKGIDIWEKYNWELPKYTNQRYNLYLKDIQNITNIQTTLTTHLARKTYATRMLNKGVSLNVVSRLLGHTNTNITQRHYAYTKDVTVLEEVKKIEL